MKTNYDLGDPLASIDAVPPTPRTTPLASPFDPVGTHFQTPEADLTLPPASTLTFKETIADKAALLTAQARTAVEGWKTSVSDSVTETIERAKPIWNAKLEAAKSTVAERVATTKQSARTAAGEFEKQLRADPSKWAGIAAGAGFAVGLLGRWMHHRAHHRVPAVLVIEASC